jgi:lysyl-tRNA synthetase class II
MSELLTAKIRTALRRKGFIERETDHVYLLYAPGGRSTRIFTFLSHGERKADESQLRLMARELHLSKAELLRLVECTISGEEYERLMIERGFVRWP